MFIGGGGPLGRQIPVIGDVVIIKDHQGLHMREQARSLRQVATEALQYTDLASPLACVFDIKRRHGWLGHELPRYRRPDQQIHGHDFGQGHQVVVCAGSRKNRFFHAAKEAFTQRLVRFECGQQVFAAVIACRVSVQRFAVGYNGAVKIFAVQAQAINQCVDGRQHGAGHVISINLVAT